MTTAPHPHVIAFGDRTLTPGDTFEPFPIDHPGFLVTFEGVYADRAYVSGPSGSGLSIPLADIPNAREDTP